MTVTEISGDSALLKRFTKDINDYYRRVNSYIWEVTGTWEYDDAEWTDLPIATTDLVANQQDYALPSTAQKVDRVEVLNSAGDYQLIKPIDKSMIRTGAMSEFYETAGMPVYYDLIGRSVFLYPKPAAASVTTTDGLKVYFSRDIDEFVSTDTTREPGFVSNFHTILSLGASYKYAISYEMTSKISFLKREINEMKKELKNFYGTRHRDYKDRIVPRKERYT